MNQLHHEAFSKEIDLYASNSLRERTNKLISADETVIEASPENELCRIIYCCGRTFISASEKYAKTIIEYLSAFDIAKKIRSPLFCGEILDVLGLDRNTFRLEPIEELMENIEYRCTHSLEFLCDNKTFLSTNTRQITKISRGDERFVIREPSVDTMYCITESNRIISFCFSRPNQGVFDNTCAIGLFTESSHRGNGYGKATASAATYDIVKDNKLALWVCQVENEPSKRIAESLGYRFLGGELRIVK